MTALSVLAELDNIRFRYPNQPAPLFEGASLEIRAGEVVMLAGPNGSGKSTLLAILTGRLRPSSGQVRVFGHDPSRADRLPSLGLITEPFHPEHSSLPVDLSVREVLTWLKILDGVADSVIDRGLDEVGLARSLLTHSIGVLSKGERQRVMLLAVLLRRPRLILADEPLEGLDAESRQIVGRALAHYVDQEGRSVFWVSHHLAETMQYANRLLEVEDRRVVERPPDRFELRLSLPTGATKEFRVPSVLALPEVVAEHLETAPSIRVEITDLQQTGAGR